MSELSRQWSFEGLHYFLIIMHKLGCPTGNNPYASCKCAAMDMREHTEQLQLYNENAKQIAELKSEVETWKIECAAYKSELELSDVHYKKLEAENAKLREVIEVASIHLYTHHNSDKRLPPCKCDMCEAWNELDKALEELK